jgi:hypothetical protein
VSLSNGFAYSVFWIYMSKIFVSIHAPAGTCVVEAALPNGFDWYFFFRAGSLRATFSGIELFGSQRSARLRHDALTFTIEHGRCSAGD